MEGGFTYTESMLMKIEVGGKEEFKEIGEKKEEQKSQSAESLESLLGDGPNLVSSSRKDKNIISTPSPQEKKKRKEKYCR